MEDKGIAMTARDQTSRHRVWSKGSGHQADLAYRAGWTRVLEQARF
jgi:predicted glycosyl hydrolase (DUF1957 family)